MSCQVVKPRPLKIQGGDNNRGQIVPKKWRYIYRIDSPDCVCFKSNHIDLLTKTKDHLFMCPCGCLMNLLSSALSDCKTPIADQAGWWTFDAHPRSRKWERACRGSQQPPAWRMQRVHWWKAAHLGASGCYFGAADATRSSICAIHRPSIRDSRGC